MHKRFSSKSDVWSFGVTCWEVYAFGEDPYGDWDGKLLASLKAGQRLSKPSACPFVVWSKSIFPCFEFEAKERPAFELLYERLNRNWAELFETSDVEEDSSEAEGADGRTGYLSTYDSTVEGSAVDGGDHYSNVE